MLEKRDVRNPVPPNHARNAVMVTKLNGETGDWLLCAPAPPPEFPWVIGACPPPA
jgi:hypothetical protein